MLKCQEVTQLCSRELDQDIPLRQKISLGAHLLMCSGCTNYRRQLSALRIAARRYAQGGGMPAQPDREPGE